MNDTDLLKTIYFELMAIRLSLYPENTNKKISDMLFEFCASEPEPSADELDRLRSENAKLKTDLERLRRLVRDAITKLTMIGDGDTA